MSDPLLVGLCGALRAESVNRKLLRESARLFGPCRFEEGDLRLPLFDEDLQIAEGIPPEVQRLSDLIAAADAVVISTPEYNKAPPGVLKNALDWISRRKPTPWADKPVALMSAAAGRAGGLRAQTMLRTMMTPFGVRLVPASEVAIAGAASEFDETGHLSSERYEASVQRLMDALQKEIGRS